MALPEHLLRDVTLVRPSSSTDRYNNTARDYGSGATRTTIRAWLQRNTGTEPLADARDPLIGPGLLLTNHADVQGFDRIEDGSVVYEVTGPAAPVHRGGQGVHHYEASIRAVTG